MSYEAMSWAVRQKVGGPTGKLILMVLANFADENGVSFPSQRRLAADCECSSRTVQDWLNKFEELGIARRKERRRDSGYRTSDEITLLINPQGSAATPSVSPEEFSGEKFSGENDDRSHRKNLRSKNQSVLTTRLCAERATDREQAEDTVPRQTLGAAPTETSGAALPYDRTWSADFQRVLREAAGDAINAAHPAFLNLAEPIGWMAGGCDLELDILPTISGLAARIRGSPVRSWMYFSAAVLEARDRRLAAKEVRPVSAPAVLRPRLKSTSERLADAMERSARGEDPFPDPFAPGETIDVVPIRR